MSGGGAWPGGGARWAQRRFRRAAADLEAQIAAARDNLVQLNRPGAVGLATIWDANEFVQCRRLRNHDFYGEAAGVRMQPSLARVLFTDRVARLAAKAWRIDPRFGLYAHSIRASSTTATVAGLIIQTLAGV